jgi:hypothetical protein
VAERRKARQYHRDGMNYVGYAYPQFQSYQALDTWYENKTLYGKIDTREDAVVLSEVNLKSFRTDEAFKAVDFVVDAFENFLIDVNLAKAKGVVAPSSFVQEIEIFKAWESGRVLYKQYMENVYSGFTARFLNEQVKPVQTFNDFIDYFKEFIRETAKDLPITFCEFVTSRLCPLNTSGLVVEVSDLDPNSMQDRTSFISDESFGLYKNLARKYGFRVDVNVPWRLVADIASKEMQYFMNKPEQGSASHEIRRIRGGPAITDFTRYGIEGPRELFDTYYYRTYKFDPIVLKKFLIDFYNSYVNASPFTKTVATAGSETPKLRSCFITRTRIAEHEVNQEYDDIFWLEYYLFTRLREIRDPESRVVETKIIKRAINLYKVLDYDAALSYINDEVFKRS